MAGPDSLQCRTQQDRSDPNDIISLVCVLNVRPTPGCSISHSVPRSLHSVRPFDHCPTQIPTVSRLHNSPHPSPHISSRLIIHTHGLFSVLFWFPSDSSLTAFSVFRRQFALSSHTPISSMRIWLELFRIHSEYPLPGRRSTR